MGYWSGPDMGDVEKAVVLRASAGLPLAVVLARLNAVDEGRDWRVEMDRDVQDPAVRQALSLDDWPPPQMEDDCLPF